MSNHSGCIPKAQYWSLYNKIKDDMLYIENRELRKENNALKQKISELETKNLGSPQPTSLPLFSRGIAINTRTNQPTFKATNQSNKCQAIRKDGRPCR